MTQKLELLKDMADKQIDKLMKTCQLLDRKLRQEGANCLKLKRMLDKQKRDIAHLERENRDLKIMIQRLQNQSSQSNSDDLF